MFSGIKIVDVDLALVKDYLRIDHGDDDTMLKMMLAASQSYIQNYLNRKFSDYELNGEEIPDEFTIACLALVAHWYEKREIQSKDATQRELSYIFSGLLDLHRNWNNEAIPE